MIRLLLSGMNVDTEGNLSSWPFYLLSVVVFLVFCASALFTKTMFMDGLIYSVVSRNMGFNVGSIWEPVFTSSLFNPFYGHPPLAIWLQSLWFRAFGESWLIERVYSLIVTVFTGVLLVGIWKQVVGSFKIGWLVLLFWALIPTVTWAVSSNMLETTMTFFVCASVFTYIKGHLGNKLVYVALAGLLCALGILSKGPVGLFVWAIPFLVWLIHRSSSFGKMVTQQLVIITFTALPIAVMMIASDEAVNSLIAYVDNQFSNSVTKSSGHHRFRILFKLVEESYLMLILFVVGVMLKRCLKIESKSEDRIRKWAAVFFLLAMAGTFPILVSLKQRPYYLHSALPFLAMGFSLLSIPLIARLIDKIKVRSTGFKVFRCVSLILVLVPVVIVVMQFGKRGGDRIILQDQHLISEFVGNGSDIAICPDLDQSWSLHGYFARFAHINLHWTNQEEYQWLIMRDDCNSELELNLKRIDIPTVRFHLYSIQPNDLN